MLVMLIPSLMCFAVAVWVLRVDWCVAGREWLIGWLQCWK